MPPKITSQDYFPEVPDIKKTTQATKKQYLTVHKVYTRKMTSIFNLSFKELVMHVIHHDSKWVPVGMADAKKGIFEYAKIADIKKLGIQESDIDKARTSATNRECAKNLGTLILEKRITFLLQKAITRGNSDELHNVLAIAVNKEIDLSKVWKKVTADLSGTSSEFAKTVYNTFYENKLEPLLAKAIAEKDRDYLQNALNDAVDNGIDLPKVWKKVTAELSGISSDFAKTVYNTFYENKLEPLLTRVIADGNSDELLKTLSIAIDNGIDVGKLQKKVNKVLKADDAVIINKIFTSYNKLKDLLPKVEAVKLFNLCSYAEKKLAEGTTQAAAVRVKKGESGLSHSLLIDFKNKTYTILLTGEEAFKGAGTAGKVKSVIEVLPKGEVRYAVQKVNLDTTKMKLFAIECEKRYGGAHTIVAYTKGNILKTAFTSELFDKDLFNAIDQNEITSAAQCFQILEDVALTLLKMHDDGVIHGDIKLENVIVRKLDDRIKAKLIDFDVAYEPEEGGRPEEKEFYGTPIYTSPEVFRSVLIKKEFSLEERKAQDMYALGKLISMLLNPWLPRKTEEECRNEMLKDPDNTKVRLQDVDEWLQAVEEKIIEVVQAVPKTRGKLIGDLYSLQTEKVHDRIYELQGSGRAQALTFGKRVELITCQLLRPEVNERMTIVQFLKELNSLKLDFRKELEV